MSNSKFNSNDSFAYWVKPTEDLTGKSPDECEKAFKSSYQENHFPNELLPNDLDEYLSQIKYVLVGLNAGNAAVNQPADQLFLNFHGKKRSSDYRMAAAVYGTELWGTFMTDVSPVIESKSPDVKISQNDVIALDKHLKELGIPDDATLIALGGKAFNAIHEYSTHPVTTMYHYSSINRNWTAQIAKDQINEIISK